MQTEKTYLYIGSYTEGKPNKGIYIYEFDVETGKTKLVQTIDSIVNPSFLKIDQEGALLYAVSESQLQTNGKVAVFRMDPKSGKIKLINKQDSGGRNPVHLAFSEKNQLLINSNYTDPSVAVFKKKSDGSLEPYAEIYRFKDSSIVKGRQDQAHIHSANFSPDNRYVFAQDLGGDKIRAFEVLMNSDSLLKERQDLTIRAKPGSGLRHFTFHQNGRFGYGVAELNGMITQYDYHDGKLVFVKDYLSYSKKQEIYRTADIHVSPDGKFLYASNRGPDEDSISIFSIDQQTGKLLSLGHESTYGEHPRNFGMDPSGNFLVVANQFSDNVVIFRRDQKTGRLHRLPDEIKVSQPSSIQMYTYK